MDLEGVAYQTKKERTCRYIELLYLSSMYICEPYQHGHG
jgi:hypothetical protein